MTTTQFTDAVEIDGSQDTTQLKVQGNAQQETPLQVWEDSTADALAQLTGDGRLQLGDVAGQNTPDALVDIHRESTATTKPKQGLQVSGELANETDTAVTWSVHELTLSGGSTTVAQATALRAGLTTDGADVDTTIGVEIAIDKQSTGTIDEAIGLNITDIDQATDNYALRTGKGKTHLGDVLQLDEQSSTPATAAGTMQLYPKTDGKLYAQNDNGQEFDLSQTTFADTHANRPNSGVGEGDLFLPTDAFGLERKTASDWEVWGPLYKLTPPDLTNFSWVNQGDASAVQSANTIHFDAPQNSGDNLRLLVMSAPSTPYTITMHFSSLMWHAANNSMGMVWRNSSSGKLVTLSCLTTSSIKSYKLEVLRYNSPTSWNSNITSMEMPGLFPWLRIQDDGTNRKSFISVNGQNWVEVHAISRTDFITPDQVGIFINPQDTGSDGHDLAMHLLSWEVS